MRLCIAKKIINSNLVKKTIPFQLKMSTTQHFDCVVVGAGIEGSAAAYSLINAGHRTLLLEKFPLPHTRGSSHGASRICRQAYPADTPVYQHIMTNAFPQWLQLEALCAQTLFTKTGLLWMGLRKKGEVHAMYKHMKSTGLQCDLYNSTELKRRYPQLNYDADYEALWDPSAGVLAADKCVLAFQNAFKRAGGVIIDGEEVLKLSPGYPVRIQTTKRSITADSVVLCMGAWAGPFVKQHLQLDLKLTPHIIKVAYWKNASNSHSLSRGFPCIITESKNEDHFYGLPNSEYPGLFKFCEHTGYAADPDQRDAARTDVIQDQLNRASSHVRTFLPEIETKPAIVETCIYTMSESHHPFIDRHPMHSNIIIAAGFSGHGFKLAPVVGEIVTDLVNGKQPIYDMKLFEISKSRLCKNVARL